MCKISWNITPIKRENRKIRFHDPFVSVSCFAAFWNRGLAMTTPLHLVTTRAPFSFRYYKTAGTYIHAVWGSMVVTPQVDFSGKIYLAVQVGKFGTGNLCWSSVGQNSNNVVTLRFRMSASSPLVQFGFNDPLANIAGQVRLSGGQYYTYCVKILTL